MPPDAKPLFYNLYADKTNLSTHGTEKGYPVVARITNFPIDIRNGEGLGGGCVVGWLPIVSKLSISYTTLTLIIRLMREKRKRIFQNLPGSKELCGMSPFGFCLKSLLNLLRLAMA